MAVSPLRTMYAGIVRMPRVAVKRNSGREAQAAVAGQHVPGHETVLRKIKAMARNAVRICDRQ
jgi:hypothetical protein